MVRGGSAIYYDTWDIFNRLIERVILGPVGVGTDPAAGQRFLPRHLPAEGFGSLPAAIQPTSLSGQPTNFTGGSTRTLIQYLRLGAEAEIRTRQ